MRRCRQRPKQLNCIEWINYDKHDVMSPLVAAAATRLTAVQTVIISRLLSVGLAWPGPRRLTHWRGQHCDTDSHSQTFVELNVFATWACGDSELLGHHATLLSPVYPTVLKYAQWRPSDGFMGAREFCKIRWKRLIWKFHRSQSKWNTVVVLVVR